MSQTDLPQTLSEGTNTEMDAATESWGAAVEELEVGNPIDGSPIKSSSQISFRNPKLSKFSKIDD